MNKSQLFAVLMLVTLGLIIASIVIFDSNASIEMQQCGGCHNPEYTQRMAGTTTWPAVFNAIVPEHRGERAKPCSEGYVRGCTKSGCHDGLTYEGPTHGSKQLHKDMTASECTRCHVMGTEPMYAECTMCHGDYKHANPVEGNCMDCHPGHTTDTSAGCSDCHAKEYAELEEFGGKHAAKDTGYDARRYRLSPTTYSYEPPLIGEGCYSCHKEHGESLSWLFGLPCKGVCRARGIRWKARSKGYQLRCLAPPAEPDNIQLRTAADRRGMLFMSQGTWRIPELSGLPYNGTWI